MKAFVYHQDKKLALEDRDLPQLGEQNAAVIRVLSCSICGTDIRTFRFGSAKIGDGRIIGHEVTGEIVELAPDLNDSFKVGDKIAIAPAIGCGRCPCCLRGKTNMCDNLTTIGFEYDGGFADYMGVPHQAFVMGNAYVLPEAIDYAPYSLAEPLACVLNAHAYLAIRPGDDVVIFGSGIIGCLHAEMAFRQGARQVLIVEPMEERRRQAQELLPQTVCSGLAGADLEKLSADLTAGKGMDVAIIACSVGSAQAQGMRLLGKCGRISLFGGLPGESAGFIDSNLIHYREISVYGVHASTPAQNVDAMQLIRDGQIDVRKYISCRYCLEDIRKAFQDAADARVMKAVIESDCTR